jgi:Cu(I)/Ag(I) efflux system membrane fusion protein
MDLVPAEEFGFIADLTNRDKPLLVPASAILRTGSRAIVYVRLPERDTPTFEGREIVLGPRVGDRFIVAEGLAEGEMVVTQGAFKLDSELQLKAKPSMMNPAAGLSEVPAHSAPESLTGQWPAIPRALHRFLENPNQERIGALKSLIRAIDPAQLQPDELARWNEFSRRLLNDLEVASQSIATAPKQATAQVARAFEHAGRFLGLPYQPDPTAPTDPATTAALREVTAAYLPLADALAQDDDPAAIKAAQNLITTLDTLDNPVTKTLTAHAHPIVHASDIKARRAAFQPLSDHLISLIRKHGTDAVGNAYVVHCPMAFGNKGADWLSAQPAVLNPYFGDAMLTCGSVTDTLSIDEKSPPPKAPPTKLPPPATAPKKPSAPATPADPHAGH